MPTYDYRCPKCGKIFEDFRPITDPESECPICGIKGERLISSGAGLLFKGSGFYITDHRSPEYNTKAAAEKDIIGKAPESRKATG
jgi:putative FmdB family regulatory protein